MYFFKLLITSITSNVENNVSSLFVIVVRIAFSGIEDIKF